MAVAIAVGRKGVDSLLIASQVALSIVLPFIILPLLYLTSSKSIMCVKKPSAALTGVRASDSPCTDDVVPQPLTDADLSNEEVVDYSNGKVVSCLGYLIWFIVLAANVYAIVTLAMGKGQSS